MLDGPVDGQRTQHANADCPPQVAVVLAHHYGVGGQIRHVGIVRFIFPQHEPADVRVPETLLDVVGGALSVDVAVVVAVQRGLLQRRGLERRASEC